MWITSYISKDKEKSPSFGEVSKSSVSTINFNGSSILNDVNIVAPFGISYCPVSNSEGVVVPVQESTFMLGVKAGIDDSLEPGELLLYSKGGASILLKNDGKVYVNGKAIG
jgi:phage gp45-like